MHNPAPNPQPLLFETLSSLSVVSVYWGSGSFTFKEPFLEHQPKSEGRSLLWSLKHRWWGNCIRETPYEYFNVIVTFTKSKEKEGFEIWRIGRRDGVLRERKEGGNSIINFEKKVLQKNHKRGLYTCGVNKK